MLNIMEALEKEVLFNFLLNKKTIIVLFSILIYLFFYCFSFEFSYVKIEIKKIFPITIKNNQKSKNYQVSTKKSKRILLNSKKSFLKNINFSCFKHSQIHQNHQSYLAFLLRRNHQNYLKEFFFFFQKSLKVKNVDLYSFCKKQNDQNFIEKIQYKKYFSEISKEKKLVRLNSKKLNVSKKKNKKNLLIIMIDPGHGGEDPGAIGKYGTLEKDVVLSISKKLNKLINSNITMKSYMTRKEDKFISLSERIYKTHRLKANLLISIHANSCKNRNAFGSSVFIFSKEQKNDFCQNDLLQSCLSLKNLKNKKENMNNQIETIRNSFKLGCYILKKISTVNKLHKKEVETANFVILGMPKVPSVLVETAFISNAEEEKNLNKLRFQKKIAESIFQGIKLYSETNLKKL
ncbi:N-acetylmuramoyl-L-alanine amidase family protein [Candidatus Riesia pediculicola]|nr:N-acetylmuramoyl-L-alanine amidase [Candidatus Riesia pediculicola]QOJ86471.1 N-acetylmuramoyl-L-alanine amidase [Candidatus Riesia pediculicola]